MRFTSLALALLGVFGQDDESSMLQQHHSKRHQADEGDVAPCDLKGTWSTDEQIPRVPSVKKFANKLRKLDVQAVVTRLRDVLKQNHDCWPSDHGSYGPLMVRLAWHCSGTFRTLDGAGGCAGGRMRFFPEANWGDNGNLDKARSFLAKIKDEFGDGLSWGDLFVLAGTVAISEMGGPTKEFCFGRIDEDSGEKSLMLNCDSDEDNQGKPCSTLDPDWKGGQDVAGNIYVDPQGPHGDPNPYLSAQDVERTFSRMNMTFSQTTALIGGGHAFGKAHGNPSGVFTSGFEGQWTNNPTRWDNEYFKALMLENWDKHETESGKIQWRTVDRESEFKNTMMLTADMALKSHPHYSVDAMRFATDQEALDVAFKDAWWTLTTNGDGWLPYRQCIRLEDY